AFSATCPIQMVMEFSIASTAVDVTRQKLPRESAAAGPLTSIRMVTGFTIVTMSALLMRVTNTKASVGARVIRRLQELIVATVSARGSTHVTGRVHAATRWSALPTKTVTTFTILPKRSSIGSVK